jgi:hypothetical protein
VGLVQHAYFTVPNYAEGYTTDDNARGLAVAVLLEQVEEVPNEEAYELATRYLAFLWYAFAPATGRFRNFLSFERRWLEEVGSEDAHGRALWGLGMVVGRSQQEGLCSAATRLFDAALPAAGGFSSPRAWAFTLLAIQEYLRRFEGDRAARSLREELAQRLGSLYRQVASDEWRWFEDRLAYANAVLPGALLVAGQALGRQDLVSDALAALDWLCGVQTAPEGHFVPVGSNGFYVRGGVRARFDQQPIEAQATVSACLSAYAVTGEVRWRQAAQKAFDWFLGQNDLGQSLYDHHTGGCRDGLHPDRSNQNEGAESTLAFLQALLELRLAESLGPELAAPSFRGQKLPCSARTLT